MVLETNWDGEFDATHNGLSATDSDDVLETTHSDGVLPISFTNRSSRDTSFPIVSRAASAFSACRNGGVRN